MRYGRTVACCIHRWKFTQRHACQGKRRRAGDHGVELRGDFGVAQKWNVRGVHQPLTHLRRCSLHPLLLRGREADFIILSGSNPEQSHAWPCENISWFDPDRRRGEGSQGSGRTPQILGQEGDAVSTENRMEFLSPCRKRGAQAAQIHKGVRQFADEAAVRAGLRRPPRYGRLAHGHALVAQPAHPARQACCRPVACRMAR